MAPQPSDKAQAVKSSGQSRCGWVDQPEDQRRLAIESLAAAFTLEGALVLPWFLAPIPNLGVDPSSLIDAVERAFAMWQEATPVRFPRQAQASSARLMVSWNPIDGLSGVIGRTHPGGPMQLDVAEHWSVTIPPREGANVDVLTIALHEIGHVIGIGDIPSDPTAVMHGFFGAGDVVIRRAFTTTDLQAIAARFST